MCGRGAAGGRAQAALVKAAERALQALAARQDVVLVDESARQARRWRGGVGGNRTLRRAPTAAVGLTAGLFWYLWRTHPRGRRYGVTRAELLASESRIGLDSRPALADRPGEDHECPDHGRSALVLAFPRRGGEQVGSPFVVALAEQGAASSMLS